MKNRTIENILIIQTAFIGDVILTTPLIRETKKAFSSAHIDVIVIPQTKNILENNPYLRSLLVFDKRRQKLRAFFSMVKKIRATRYDIAFAAHRSFTSAWLLLLGGIRKRIGFTGKSAAILLSDRVKFPQHKRQVDRYLDLLRYLGVQTSTINSELFFTKEIESRATELLSSLTADGPTLAVAPGSVRATKRWPEERFIELLQMLGTRNVNIVLIGSPGEKALCDAIWRQAGVEQCLNLAGETSLLEAAAVIKKCDLLLCNDSGTMHMANAVETDVFAFFGPTIEFFGFTPFRPNDKIFQVDLYCRPCGTHGGDACPEGHFRCMRDISVQLVFDAIVKRLHL